MSGDGEVTWLARLSPIAAVGATCALSLVLLRAELVQVPYLNDSAVHEEMVRFALVKLEAGHLPFDSWFPFLNLGSPQYLHYQSLGAILTAVAAAAVGVGRAFTWSTWLLVCCWPACVYASARLFGLSRAAACAAGMLSPFISSFTGVGYEQASYLSSGFGLWSQLWAMWTLPLAWALSWRAVDERRFVAPAAVLVAATAAFHFETGYLAFIAVGIFVLVRPSELVVRAGRGLLVVAGALGLCSFVVVPLVAQGKWAAVNQFLQSGSQGVDANSYGARQVLSALFQGEIFDWHHIILITPLCAAGFIVCALAWRGRRHVPAGAARAIASLFAASVVLFFGRPTLGPVLHLLPGSRDLFLRRFIVGVQLSGLLLAGIAAGEIGRLTVVVARRVASSERSRLRQRIATGTATAVLAGVAVAVLVPSWSFVATEASMNATLVSAQAQATRAERQLDVLIAIIKRDGNGRTFAGELSGSEPAFTVGDVLVYQYLASRDVDEVGFTLRTASLMSGPEEEFDPDNPADYKAFGIRYLLLPTSMVSPVPAERVRRSGPYALWEIPGNSYVQVVDTRGTIEADSGDLGSFAASFLADLPVLDPIYPTVGYDGGAPAAPTLAPGAQPGTPAGSVVSERADLAGGNLETTVDLRRKAVVLLSASYDPGWQALVDGRPAATEMVAPALVGVTVGPGRHTVRFVYKGFPDYPALFAVAGVSLVALVALELVWRRRRAR